MERANLQINARITHEVYDKIGAAAPILGTTKGPGNPNVGATVGKLVRAMLCDPVEAARLLARLHPDHVDAMINELVKAAERGA